MKKLIPFAGIGAMAILVALPASADEVVRKLDSRFSAADASRVTLDFPVGELIVEAGSGREVEVHVELECDGWRKSRCTEAAKKIEIVAGTGNKLNVQLKGWPKNGDHGLEGVFRVTVPRDLPLTADLGVGEMRISGLEADLSADLGVGDVSVTMPESAVAEVRLNAGVGDASLSAGGRSFSGKGFVGKELDWTGGSGKARVKIDCGVGEANVKLE